MTSRSELEQDPHGAPAALALLSEPERADLLQLLRAARRKEATALNAAVDAVLDALPRPLRTVTKKIMFGDLADR